MSKGSLYLIPNMIGESSPSSVLPAEVKKLINGIDVYIAENIKTVRRSLIKMGIDQKIDDLTFLLFNKKTDASQARQYLDYLLEGKDVGLMSEAGNPAIADPAGLMVNLAHEKDIRVIPVVGPSSVTLALAGSGFNGQQFTFHGYLPIKGHERRQKIKQLENALATTGYTQIFMETPYRNHQLLEDIIKSCKDSTRLCVATDLTLPGEQIISKRIRDWKKVQTDIHKRPSIFLLGR